MKRKTRPMKAIPKQLGKRLTPKGPARDTKHLAKVRGEFCLCCDSVQLGATEAHHCRHLAPRTMGKRVSDYLTVPLCWTHHQCRHHGVHGGNEADFWANHSIDPREWIRTFSPEGAAALTALEAST